MSDVLNSVPSPSHTLCHLGNHFRDMLCVQVSQRKGSRYPKGKIMCSATIDVKKVQNDTNH